MEVSFTLDENFTCEEIGKCVDELCKYGVSKGSFDMPVLCYVVKFLTLFEAVHKKGGED